MHNYFEIDFLKVNSAKSGDAICMRYFINGERYIHVVDAGYQSTGSEMLEHINQYYDHPDKINHLVLTHPDGDHAGGLQYILEMCNVENVWMARPWMYAEELIHRFAQYTSVDGLKTKLKECYPNVAALEEIALRKGFTIRDPFQGSNIGAFKVLAPSWQRYLDLIVSSEKTPLSTKEDQMKETWVEQATRTIRKYTTELIAAAWGEEVFSDDPVSNENEHHGSRRNVNTELLDQLLGPRLTQKLPDNQKKFTAIISASAEDNSHPRKSVVRAMIHRGGKTISTENKGVRIYRNAPPRQNWGPVDPLVYPEQQEE